MNVRESLISLSNYPVPMPVVENVGQAYSLDLDIEASVAVRETGEYKKAKAAIYIFLSTAPDVTQGGITFRLSDKDKARFRNLAISLLEDVGAISLGGVDYGYKGEQL